MQPLLQALGVPLAVQEWFAPYYRQDDSGNLLFDYGTGMEHYGPAFHRLPFSGAWQAGEKALAAQLFICSSAMEAIAFLALNSHRFPKPDSLMFGTPGTTLLKKRTGLVLGGDLLGRLADIKFAAPSAQITYCGAENFSIHYQNNLYAFSEANLSLNAFEKASGHRSGLRTYKPKDHYSYLTQLQCKP